MERVGDIEGPAVAAIREVVEHAARRGAHLVVTGETGTGKERLARIYHAASGRRGKLVTRNCADLTGGTARAELFGHVRGAFTGAVDAKVGALEEANGGTLFLDELKDLAAEAQAMLLRAIEQGEILPVGAERTKRVDVRFVCAGRDVEEALAKGAFREDAYERLAGERVRLPPLRERREEIPWLVAMEVNGALAVNAAFVEECLGRPWKTNARGLRNAVARALAAAQRRIARGKAEGNDAREEILPIDLAKDDGGGRVRVDAGKMNEETREALAGVSAAALRRGEEEEEQRVWRRLLEKHKGNVSALARELGMERTTVQSKLARWGWR